MSVIICDRCGKMIDMDYNCEVFTNAELPGIAKNDYDFVCFDCLTDEEAEKLDFIN